MAISEAGTATHGRYSTLHFEAKVVPYLGIQRTVPI